MINIRDRIKGFRKGGDHVNERGNAIERYFTPDGDRYHYDFMDGFLNEWDQYDTQQDAWYFGVWINNSTRQVLSYAEGDVTLVTCPTEESYRAEIAMMNEFYGKPPPYAVAIDVESGEVTEFRQERP